MDSWKGLILVAMSNVCYLPKILIFLVVNVRYLVVTADYCCYLVFTGGYILLVTDGLVTDGYCLLMVVTARYCSFPLFI